MGLFSRDRPPQLILFGEQWVYFATLLVENWQEFAALGWEQYQAVGRGFVHLNSDGSFGYVAAAAPALVASRNEGDRIVRNACARYRPDREIVIAGTFARDEKAVRAGKVEWRGGAVQPRFKEMLRPPDAYKQAVADAIEVAGFQYLQERRRRGLDSGTV